MKQFPFKFILRCFYMIFITFFSCDKDNLVDDDCGILVDGVYQFPELPPNHGMTKEEVHEYRNLPEKVAKCITTEGLVRTCMNYPYLGLIWASSLSPQVGYGNMTSLFRGFGELASRSDRGAYLIQEYQTISDSLAFRAKMSRVSHYEIILSQYQHLEVLSTTEKAKLITTAIAVYNSKEREFDYYGASGLSHTSAIMARLMKLDHYEPFMEFYDADDFEMKSFVEDLFHTDYEVTQVIHEFAEDYLEQLQIE